jgi:hypothetical protein
MRVQLPQPAAAQIAAPAAPLYLTDGKLIAHFRAMGAPLPFGLTRLRQDRLRGGLGSIPYRKLGGKCLYNPDDVSCFLAGLPIIQAKPSKQQAVRTGRPSATELAEASRRRLTVKELRAQRTISGLESK